MCGIIHNGFKGLGRIDHGLPLALCIPLLGMYGHKAVVRLAIVQPRQMRWHGITWAARIIMTYGMPHMHATDTIQCHAHPDTQGT